MDRNKLKKIRFNQKEKLAKYNIIIKILIPRMMVSLIINNRPLMANRIYLKIINQWMVFQ